MTVQPYYRIYLAIRQGFVPLEWLQITKSVLGYEIAITPILPFLNNPKDLDPSYKTDLDLWDCFGRKSTPSYIQRNTVITPVSSDIFCTFQNIYWYNQVLAY